MKIVKLFITFERLAKAGERRNLVRKAAPYGPLHKRTISKDVDFDVGPGSGANVMVKLELHSMLQKHRRGGDELFYCVAGFREKGARKISFYRTIVPRTQI